MYTINLPDTVMLGGAYDESRASSVGLWGHTICCSGWQTCSSSSSGVVYLCWRQVLGPRRLALNSRTPRGQILVAVAPMVPGFGL